MMYITYKVINYVTKFGSHATTSSVFRLCSHMSETTAGLLLWGVVPIFHTENM